MKIIASFLAIISISLSAQAKPEVLCKTINPSSANITSFQYGTYAQISIQNSETAQVFYNAMSEVKEELLTEKEVPAGVVSFRRSGSPITCFKQVLSDCVTYQCNIPFSDLKAGKVGFPSL